MTHAYTGGLLYTGSHITSYRYSRPVFLEPHTLRLRPHSDGSQHLRSFSLEADPVPAGVSETLDIESNGATRIWFKGLSGRLTVTTTFVVETRRVNPFDFILHDRAARLPLAYARGDIDRLSPYRRRESDPVSESNDDPVADFAHDVAREAGYGTLDYLMALTLRINRLISFTVRETGQPFDAAKTLATRSGACRDLSVLFMDACRVMGLAARFVSGYQEGDLIQERRDMHAWVSVYLPLAGWRSYDPTLGLAVADRHIEVAASACPMSAAPVTGAFRGNDVTASLSHNISIKPEGSSGSGEQENNPPHPRLPILDTYHQAPLTPPPSP